MGKRGRPPLSPESRSTRVCLALPAHVYDLAFTHARSRRETIPQTLRRALLRLLRDERGGVATIEHTSGDR